MSFYPYIQTKDWFKILQKKDLNGMVADTPDLNLQLTPPFILNFTVTLEYYPAIPHPRILPCNTYYQLANKIILVHPNLAKIFYLPFIFAALQFTVIQGQKTFIDTK